MFIEKSFSDAYFGKNPVAEIIGAEKNDQIIGMVQWNLTFDMFWSKYYAIPEWLFITEKCRGTGTILPLFAFMCHRVRENGGEALYAFANENTASLLDRICVGNGPHTHYYLSGEAFQRAADLVDQPPMKTLRNIPLKDLNYVDRE